MSKLCSKCNIQPLWEADNLSKTNKIGWEKHEKAS